MSNYKANVERMADDESFEPYRETGKKCQYVNHRGGDEVHAIIMVEVDNDCCTSAKDKDENHSVRLCWRCTQYGYHDAFFCACRDEEHGRHSAEDLTFKGEIQVKVKA